MPKVCQLADCDTSVEPNQTFTQRKEGGRQKKADINSQKREERGTIWGFPRRARFRSERYAGGWRAALPRCAAVRYPSRSLTPRAPGEATIDAHQRRFPIVVVPGSARRRLRKCVPPLERREKSGGDGEGNPPLLGCCFASATALVQIVGLSLWIRIEEKVSSEGFCRRSFAVTRGPYADRFFVRLHWVARGRRRRQEKTRNGAIWE